MAGSKRARLGAHMSIAGGLYRAVERAESVDATALQIFVKSARQWKAKPIDPADAERFRDEAGRAGLSDLTVAHASYLINLAAADDALWRRSIEALADELVRCAALGVTGLVLHPGSHVGAGEQAGLVRVARGLDAAWELAGESAVRLLLETTAGQGTNLGHRFEQLGFLLDEVKQAERFGVCFDSCHVLAAGYEIRTKKGYAATMGELDEAVGLDRVLAFHLNDSKHELGSRKDRHDHIGQGEVGLEAFRLILNDRRFRDRPMVLETPKGEALDEDRENLAALRALLPKTRR